MQRSMGWMFGTLWIATRTLPGCGEASDTMGGGTGMQADDDAPTADSDDDGATGQADTGADSGGPADTGSSGGPLEETDHGEPFLQNPDGGGIANECDLWAQDCPVGHKCMPWANDGGLQWNATKCVELVKNPGVPGDPCTVDGSGISGLDDCDATSMCWDVDVETGMGVCAPFCAGSEAAPVCEDPQSSCVIANGGAIILCLALCDPLLQDCGEGDGCYPVGSNGGFACVFDADGTGAGAYGDPCAVDNVCNAGLYCAQSAAAVPDCGAARCCTSYCDLDEPDASATCPGAAGGQQCLAWYPEDATPPGFEALGGCEIPQ
jgi:hypothetical protein